MAAYAAPQTPAPPRRFSSSPSNSSSAVAAALEAELEDSLLKIEFAQPMDKYLPHNIYISICEMTSRMIRGKHAARHTYIHQKRAVSNDISGRPAAAYVQPLCVYTLSFIQVKSLSRTASALKDCIHTTSTDKSGAPLPQKA